MREGGAIILLHKSVYKCKHTLSSFLGGWGGKIILAKGHQCPIMECWGVCYKS